MRNRFLSLSRSYFRFPILHPNLFHPPLSILSLLFPRKDTVAPCYFEYFWWRRWINLYPNKNGIYCSKERRLCRNLEFILSLSAREQALLHGIRITRLGNLLQTCGDNILLHTSYLCVEKICVLSEFILSSVPRLFGSSLQNFLAGKGTT